MKYNDNGEWKDIIVKAVDTLPVGSEIDYNGTEVPEGWEEVEEPIIFKRFERQVTAPVGQDYWEMAVNSIEGYELIGIIPKGENTSTLLTSSNLKKNSNNIVMTITYNYSSSAQTITIRFTAIYAKSNLIV